MPDQDHDPAEVTLAAIAWTQFLVVVTVVEKADMRRLRDAWCEITLSSDPLQWDWTAFGSVAVALNIASVCFHTFPLLVHRAGWKKKTRKQDSIDRRLAKTLSAVGYMFWVASLMVFIAYLNLAFVPLGLVAILAGVGYMLYGQREGTG